MDTAFKNIVVMAPTWLGDAVMSLSLVARLAASGVRVTVLADCYAARVYLGVDEVDELIVLPKSQWRRVRTLRILDIDGGVLLAPSFSSALTLFLSGVRLRVGYASDGRRVLLSDALPTHSLRGEHLTDNYAGLGERLLDHLGLGLRGAETPPIRVFDGERRTVGRMLANAGLAGKAYAVVVPGATYGPTKSWPAGKYRELVAAMVQDTPVVLAGGAAERELCASVRGDARRVVDMSGMTTLGELFALVESAGVVVANDSGVTHVAASLGVPAVVIFGSTSPTWTRPLGDNVTVIRERVHCSPCFLRECPTQLECYESITVERVLEEATAARDSSTMQRAGS